ncbi:carbohydrate kinase family protein [Candidatus Peregrinibacteria bacterium]|nr:carbohydrate kinase family protein [Candidatus Peregrinibacteria bacterium]
MSPKIFTLGSTTFDLFVKPKETSVVRISRETNCAEEFLVLPYGGKCLVEEVHEKYGGGGHNTAVGLTRLGLSAAPISCIGRDLYGKRILENLEKEGIEGKYLAYAESQTGFSIIISSFEGERTVLHHPGASADFHDFDETLLTESEGVFFNHLSSDGTSSDRIFQKIKGHFLKYPEKFLAWNPGKEQLRGGVSSFQDFLPVVDILLLNREEAELFTGKSALKSEYEEHSIQKGAHFIPEKKQDFPHYAANYDEIFTEFKKYGVQKVVITDGRKGAQLFDGKYIYFCGIDESAERKDTLGAGDAFGSALFYTLFQKKDLSFSLKCATINAGSVVSHIGAQDGLLSSEVLFSRAEKTELHQAQKSFSS